MNVEMKINECVYMRVSEQILKKKNSWPGNNDNDKEGKRTQKILKILQNRLC